MFVALVPGIAGLNEVPMDKDQLLGELSTREEWLRQQIRY